MTERKTVCAFEGLGLELLDTLLPSSTVGLLGLGCLLHRNCVSRAIIPYLGRNHSTLAKQH